MCIEMELNILVVSDIENFNSHVDKLITSYNTGINNIVFAKSIVSACELMEKNDFDLFIINLKEIDEYDIDIINGVNDHTGVIIMVNDDIYHNVFIKTYHKGVLVINRPVTVSKFIQAAKLVTLSGKKKKLFLGNDKKLEEIRLVDVAKLLLIVNEKMTEETSHRYIEKSSMDLRVTKRKSAEIVINKYIK